jgi:putative salt-induced outer membrane protein YdiY
VNSSKTIIRTTALSAILLLGMASLPAFSADAPPKGWTDSAELSFVLTNGNSESKTLGFKNKLANAWERSSFEVNALAVRADSKSYTRFALGSTNDYSVRENSTTTVNAEVYALNGRYNHKITDRFFWYVGAGWDRNRPSGIDNRYMGVGGVGNTWVDKEKVKFRTDYAVTVTHQENVVDEPGFKKTFAGLRASWGYLHKFGASTVYTNDLIFDDNVQNSPDWRADMLNTLSVSMSKHLSLKVGLQWLYDNRPSFRSVDLLDAPPPIGVKTGTVSDELDKLDTIFTTSLVINF